MTKVRIKNVKSVKVKIEPEKKVYTKVPLYLRPHKLHEHEDASDLAVSTEGQLIRKSGNNWVAFTPEYYEDKNRTPGAVLFAGTDGKISEDGNLTWDNSNYKSFYGGQQLRAGNVLYANSPSYPFANNPFTGSLIIGGGGTAFSEQFIFNHIGLNQRPIYRNTRINGTYGSPTSVLAGQSLWEMQLYAYSSSTNSFIPNSNSPINILINSDAAPSFNTTIILTGGTGNAPSIHVKNNGVVIGNRGIPYTQLANARLEVFGANSNSLSWTAQFHNSSGVSNSLLIRDDGALYAGQSSALFHSGGIGSFEYRAAQTTTNAVGTTVGDLSHVFYSNNTNGRTSIWWTRGSATNNGFGWRYFGDLSPVRFRLDGGAGVSNIVEYLQSGRQTHTVTYTATTNDDYGWLFSGTLTSRNLAGNLHGFRINPTLLAADNNQSLIGSFENYIFTPSTFTSITTLAKVINTNQIVSYIQFGNITHPYTGGVNTGATIGLNTSQLIIFGRNNIGLQFGANNNQAGIVDTSQNWYIGPAGGAPSARFHLRSSATITGEAFRVENFTPSVLLRIENEGLLRVGNAGNASPYIHTNSVGFAVDLSGTNLVFNSRTTNQSATHGMFSFTGAVLNPTSGAQYLIFIQKTFSPTSGSAQYASVHINSVINQTGGANGAVRGLLINDVVQSAPNYRAIEVVTGKSMFRNIEVQSNDTISFGDPNVDGTWRFIRNGNDLIIQRRESGVYNTKQTIAA